MAACQKNGVLACVHSCLSETPSKGLGPSYLHVSQGGFPSAVHFDFHTRLPGTSDLHPLLFHPSQPPFPARMDRDYHQQQ